MVVDKASEEWEIAAEEDDDWGEEEKDGAEFEWIKGVCVGGGRG